MKLYAFLIYSLIATIWFGFVSPFSWIAVFIYILTLIFVFTISFQARSESTNIARISEENITVKPATKRKLFADFLSLFTFWFYFEPGFYSSVDTNLRPEWFWSLLWTFVFYCFFFLAFTIRNIWNMFDFININKSVITFRNNFKKGTIDLSEQKGFYRQLEEKTSDMSFQKFLTRNKNRLVFCPRSANESIKINLHDFNISHMDKDLITQEIIKHCKLIETGDYEVNRFDF
jgi:hypothetical protein